MAAVETYAIGGACQLLHVVDHVIAARGARLYLPARKEGIIPGASPLRLPRSVGDRLARQAILSGLEFEAGTPRGDLLCDEVVEEDALDAALSARVEALTSSGWSAPPPTGARCGSARSRSRSFAPTWPRSPPSRRAATSARRSCATSRSTGRPMSARFERAIWDPVEQLPRERLRELQLERLRATVAAWSRSARLRCARSRTCVSCRSAGSPTCATTTRSACSRCRASGSYACTPRAARHPPWWVTRARTSTPGRS